MKKFLFPSLLVLALWACMPEIDVSLDRYENIKPGGDWQLPLATARLSLSDLNGVVEGIDLIPGTPITLKYFRENVFSAALSDYVKIPNQEILNTNFVLGPSFLAFDTELGSDFNLEIEVLELRSGKMRWETTSGHADTIVFEFELLNASRNGLPVKWVFETVNGSGTGVIQLEGIAFDLTNGPEPYNNLRIRLTQLNANGAQLGNAFSLKLDVEDFEPEYVYGFFGLRNIPIPANEVSFDLGALARFVDGVYFTNPRIDVSIRNQVGVPFQLTTTIEGQNAAGRIQQLGLQPLAFSAPLTYGSTTTDLYSVNNQNSQIVEFLRILPNKLRFDGNLAINALLLPGQKNFVGYNSRVEADLALELPLSFAAENLLFEQEIVDVNFGIGNPEEVSFLELYFKTTNSLPLGVTVNMIWTDTLGQPTDSIALPLLGAAPVDATGRSNGNSTQNFSVPFSDDRLTDFLRTKKIVLKARLQTTNGAPITLFPENGLEIRLSARIQINAN